MASAKTPCWWRKSTSFRLRPMSGDEGAMIA